MLVRHRHHVTWSHMTSSMAAQLPPNWLKLSVILFTCILFSSYVLQEQFLLENLLFPWGIITSNHHMSSVSSSATTFRNLLFALPCSRLPWQPRLQHPWLSLLFMRPNHLSIFHPSSFSSSTNIHTTSSKENKTSCIVNFELFWFIIIFWQH